MSFEGGQQAVVRVTLGLTEKFKKYQSQQEKEHKNRLKNRKYCRDSMPESMGYFIFYKYYAIFLN